MWPVLHLDGIVLDRDPEELRRLLAEHTGCDRSAEELLAVATAARGTGSIRQLVILPGDHRSTAGREGERGWRLRVDYYESQA